MADVDYDNEQILDWAKKNLADLKSEVSTLGIKHSARSRDAKSLQSSITLKTRTVGGFTDRISFSFPISGFFVHKGVGRGHPITNPREAKKWFDIPTEANLPELQNIVAEAGADYVVNNLKIK